MRVFGVWNESDSSPAPLTAHQIELRCGRPEHDRTRAYDFPRLVGSGLPAYGGYLLLRPTPPQHHTDNGPPSAVGGLADRILRRSPGDVTVPADPREPDSSRHNGSARLLSTMADARTLQLGEFLSPCFSASRRC